MRGIIARIALANCTGFGVTTAMPLWVNGIGPHFGHEAWWGAVVATTQILLAAASNLLAPLVLGRIASRRLAIGAAAVALLGNLLAMVPHEAAFVAGCIVSGIALGTLLSATNRIISELPSLHHGYALIILAEVSFGAIFYFTVPELIERFGLTSPFAVLAALSLSVVILLARMSTSVGHAPLRLVRPGQPGNLLAACFVLAAFATLFAGISTVQAFIVPIGRDLGLGIGEVGRLFSIGLFASIGGALLAKLVGERIGTAFPLLTGCAVMAANSMLIVLAGSVWIYGVAVTITSFFTMFTVTYIFTLLARLQEGGRWSSVGPAFLMMGYSLGPTIGNLVKEAEGFGQLGATGTALITIALLLFALGMRIDVRRRAYPAPLGAPALAGD